MITKTETPGVFYTTPAAMLKAVHELGFAEEVGHMRDEHCRYCGVWLDEEGAHEPGPHDEDCLYLQIEAYLKESGQL